MNVEEINENLAKAKDFLNHKMPGEAEILLKKVLSSSPESVSAANMLLDIYLNTDRLKEFKNLIAQIRKNQDGMLTEFQHMMLRAYIRKTADWEFYQEEQDYWKENIMAECIPFYAMGMPFSEEEFKVIMQNYVKKLQKNAPPKLSVFSYENRTFKNRKINIGFLSANWRDHPEAFIIGELIEYLNRDKFNLFLYDIDPMQKDFAYKQRIVNASRGNYYIVNRMSNYEIAQKIHADKIDILFDFNAFTFFNRIDILSWQPAPMQASYLGYPETVGGVQGLDFVVADPFAVPEEHKKNYVENVVYIKPCAYTYDNKCVLPDKGFVRKTFGLPKDATVLCCFCNDYKITPDYFDIWMNVLKKTSDTVLWLYAQNTVFEENLKAEAKKRGVDPARLYFTGRMPHAEYMVRYRLADLFLDTQYYNAHTTAIESLFMGVPVITCPGDTWPSRVCASILQQMDLPELIAKDLSEYEEKILSYASDPKKLKALKETVLKNKTTAPFFDSKKYAAGFERMCMDMIEIYEKGQKGKKA